MNTNTALIMLGVAIVGYLIWRNNPALQSDVLEVIAPPHDPSSVPPIQPITVQPTQKQINSGGPVFPKPGDPLYPVRVTPVPGGPCSYGPPCDPGLPCSQAMVLGQYDANLKCQPLHITFPTFAGTISSGGGAGQM